MFMIPATGKSRHNPRLLVNRSEAISSARASCCLSKPSCGSSGFSWSTPTFCVFIQDLLKLCSDCRVSCEPTPLSVERIVPLTIENHSSQASRITFCKDRAYLQAHKPVSQPDWRTAKLKIMLLLFRISRSPGA